MKQNFMSRKCLDPPPPQSPVITTLILAFCRQRTYPSKTAIAEEEVEVVRREVEEEVELDTREADSVLKEVRKSSKGFSH